MIAALESSLLDVVYLPLLLETAPDLLLGNPARTSPICRLLLAEAEHEVGTPGLERRVQAADEFLTLGIGEGVEESAVRDRVEPSPEPLKAECVGYQKGYLHSSQGRLPLCLLDGARSRVHSPNLQAALCEEDGVLPSSASYVQHPPTNLSTLCQPDKLPLRTAYVPWRGPPVSVVEEGSHRDVIGASLRESALPRSPRPGRSSRGRPCKPLAPDPRTCTPGASLPARANPP